MRIAPETSPTRIYISLPTPSPLILASHIATFPNERRRAREMVADPSRVKAMADHAIVNGDVTAYHRFDFLTESTQVRSFADIARSDGHRNTDLCDDLRWAIDRYRTTGLDVIVVDQTAPEHRAGGLSCVKVIIPGTLPMTFGHRFRRVDFSAGLPLPLSSSGGVPFSRSSPSSAPN